LLPSSCIQGINHIEWKNGGSLVLSRRLPMKDSEFLSLHIMYKYICLVLIIIIIAGCTGSAVNVVPDVNPDIGSSSEEDGSTAGDSDQEESAAVDNEGPEPSPLDPCIAPDTSFIVGIQYEKAAWFGPPRIDIESSAASGHLLYTYDPDKQTGSFKIVEKAVVNVPLKITFPRCMEKPVETETSYTMDVYGTCKQGVVDLTFVETWASKEMILECEKGSDACGDDKSCIYTLKLPFAYGGSAKNPLKSVILKDTGYCKPNQRVIDFSGVGGSGKKYYKFECVP
jgi:hypothetical protein